MRPVVNYVAATADGFIARVDGSFDAFPMDEEYPALREHNRHFDAVLMGRNTCEVGPKVGVASPYPTLDQYIFSTTMAASPHADATLVRGSAADAASSLERESGEAIWLCGGAQLASTLLAAGLVGEVLLKLHPVLQLLDTHVHPSGHVRPHYRIES